VGAGWTLRPIIDQPTPRDLRGSVALVTFWETPRGRFIRPNPHLSIAPTMNQKQPDSDDAEQPYSQHRGVPKYPAVGSRIENAQVENTERTSERSGEVGDATKERDRVEALCAGYGHRLRAGIKRSWEPASFKSTLCVSLVSIAGGFAYSDPPGAAINVLGTLAISIFSAAYIKDIQQCYTTGTALIAIYLVSVASVYIGGYTVGAYLSHAKIVAGVVGPYPLAGAVLLFTGAARRWCRFI
jgi:hypothetical protein